MRVLDILYHGTMEGQKMIDNKEYIESVKKMDVFLNNISLDSEKKDKLEVLILETQATAERQGFEFGFKYAMSLIKECSL